MTSYESTTRQMPAPDVGACTLIRDLLPLYIEGEVSPSSRDLIVEHLARCEHCAGFLAGAQSVRAQLRRDRQPRTPAAASAPPQPIPASGHKLLLAIGMVTTCVFAIVGNLMLQNPLGRDGSRSSGLIIVLLCLGALVLLGRTRGAWTVARAATLAITYLIGCAAAMLLRFVGQEPVAVIACIPLGLIALAGIWRTVWNSSVADVGIIPAITLYPPLLAGAICLVAGSFMFIVTQALTGSINQALVITLFLASAVYFLWQHAPKTS